MRHNLVMLVSCLVCALTLNFTSCKEENTETLYKGTVVNSVDKRPFENLEIKVTDGKNINAVEHTDSKGFFSILVRYNEINRSYYLLIGDTSCVPVKREFKGFGQAEIDLGTIEVEGPKVPTVKTFEPTDITPEGATVGGDVTDDGRATVTERGICYSTEEYPTLESGKRTINGSGKGEFTGTLTELEHNTTYYVRAYAKNRIGTAYGEQVKFTTELGVPIVILDSVYRITAHSAKCKGHVESDGGYAVTKKGTCWSRQPDPTVDDECTNDGSGNSVFTSTLGGLLENTTYYVRTYATNATATVYGEQIIITTLDGLAVVRTDSVNNITATGFTAFGSVISDCDIPVTARGFCYSTSQYPTIEDEHTTVGKGLGSFQGNIRNLSIGMTYYVRAYATNETGTSYGQQISITTRDGLPLVETKEATSTATTIAVMGEITETWGYNVTERGFVYSQQNTQPTTDDSKITTGKGIGVFNITIQSLNPESQYHIRAYAVNENGTSYGKTIKVATKDGKAIVTLGAITDITAQSAYSLVSVTNLGGASNLQSCGLCWSTDANPTITDSIVEANGKQLNTNYSCLMSKLLPNVTYYVRAFATTDVVTSYSEQRLFKTNDGLPMIETLEVGENITQTSAISGGNITDDGGFPITERGVCWSTFPYPTINDPKTIDGTGIGYFSSHITNIDLTNNTYYIRAYATNENGTSYGEQVSVTPEVLRYVNLPTLEFGGYVYKLYKLGNMSYKDGYKACENLVFNGFDDWYMPNREELYNFRNFLSKCDGCAYWSWNNGSIECMEWWDSCSCWVTPHGTSGHTSAETVAVRKYKKTN